MKGWFSCAQVWAGSQRGQFKDADGFHFQFKAIFISILEMSLGSGSKFLSNLSHLLQIIHLICPVHLFHPIYLIYLIEDSERSEKEAEVSPVAIVSLKTRRHQLFPQFVCQSWSCGFSKIGGKLWKRKQVGFEEQAANANGNLLRGDYLDQIRWIFRKLPNGGGGSFPIQKISLRFFGKEIGWGRNIPKNFVAKSAT